VKADHQRMLWERYRQIMADAPRENESLDLASNLLNRAFYFELKTFLHGLLVVEDRMSMAHSMETRVPFLDDNLGELALAMKPNYKVKPDRAQHDLKGGKTILRSAMKHYLPAKFVRQKKKGFSPPDENWYRGPSMEYIKEILLDPKTRARPFLNSRFVEEKLNDHFSGRQNNRLLIWSLLCFEWLQRHFIDEKMPASGLRGLNGKVALLSTETPKQE